MALLSCGTTRRRLKRPSPSFFHCHNRRFRITIAQVVAAFVCLIVAPLVLVLHHKLLQITIIRSVPEVDGGHAADVQIHSHNSYNSGKGVNNQELELLSLSSSSSRPRKSHPNIVDCFKIADLPKDGRYVRTLTKPPFEMNVHDPENDKVVSKEIVQKGCFEGALVQTMMQTLQELELDNHSSSITTTAGNTKHSNNGGRPILIDIGANIGMHSLAAAAAGVDVIAFEPFRANWGRICNSIKKNSLESKLTLWNAAVSYEDKRILSFQRLTVKNFGAVKTARDDAVRGGGGGGAIVPDIAGQEEGLDYAQGVSLSSIWQAGLLNVDSRPIVIKVDIEGGECDALVGGLEYLKKANVVYLQMETSKPRLKSTCRNPQGTQFVDVFAILMEKGLAPHMYNIVTKRLDPLPKEWNDWKQLWIPFDVVWKKP